MLDGACRIWEDLKIPYEGALTRLRRGTLRRELGEATGALLDFEAARATFDKLGAYPDLDQLDRMLHTESTTEPMPRTVMVTDVVGSTRLASALGDEAWTKLLA